MEKVLKLMIPLVFITVALFSGVNPSGNKVAATLDAETGKVIGTVRNLGNAGAAFDAAIGAAPPANGVYFAGISSGATGGLLIAPTVCDLFANIQQTGNAQIITGVSGRRIYICAANLVTATAQNVAIVAGTGTTCATTTVAVPGTAGGLTAATGWNLAANSGIVLGTGIGVVAKTTVNQDNLCVFQSGSGQLSGGISYAIY